MTSPHAEKESGVGNDSHPPGVDDGTQADCSEVQGGCVEVQGGCVPVPGSFLSEKEGGAGRDADHPSNFNQQRLHDFPHETWSAAKKENGQSGVGAVTTRQRVAAEDAKNLYEICISTHAQGLRTAIKAASQQVHGELQTIRNQIKELIENLAEERPNPNARTFDRSAVAGTLAPPKPSLHARPLGNDNQKPASCCELSNQKGPSLCASGHLDADEQGVTLQLELQKLLAEQIKIVQTFQLDLQGEEDKFKSKMKAELTTLMDALSQKARWNQEKIHAVVVQECDATNRRLALTHRAIKHATQALEASTHTEHGRVLEEIKIIVARHYMGQLAKDQTN
eukprot:GHVT01101927.1.p1 GENE.GHVT01101927.1~~GHVT01101927.1.p1  ORF type:complete len:338 (-),score=38.57 GHVT01101927.1:754-1767(-)